MFRALPMIPPINMIQPVYNEYSETTLRIYVGTDDDAMDESYL
jgi:hypothetical protein